MGGMAALIPSRKDEEANAARDRGRQGGQEARGQGRLRRHLGRAPRRRRRRAGRLRRGPRRPPEPDRQAALRRRRLPRATARRRLHAGRDHRGGPAQRRQRRLPVHLVLARRARRGGHQQPHGRRRHRRDLALTDLAMGPPRQVRPRPRPQGPRRGDGQDPRRRRRRGLGEGPPRRDQGDLRARRPLRRLPGVPDAPRVRVHRLESISGVPAGTLAGMLRVAVVLALIAALLCAAPTAWAQSPWVTVSTAYGTVTPSYVAGTMTPRGGDDPTIIIDGFGLNQPTLMAVPGSVVTITLSAGVEVSVGSVGVSLGGAQLPMVPAGEAIYTVTVPADASLPAKLGVRVESSTENSG